LENIYKENQADFSKGFAEIIEGDDVCIVSTGYMVRKAIRIATLLKTKGISAGVVDVFRLKPVPDLSVVFSKYNKIFSIEEGFINVGGLDSLILNVIAKNNLQCVFLNAGFDDKYAFQLGSREYIYETNNLGDKFLEERIIKWK
jgi:transketolase